ncbi:MAG: 5-oxoprolinase subunit PxpB [Henriciella sp.]
MRATLMPVRIADDLFEFSVKDPPEARALAKALGDHPLALEVVAGLDRVAVQFALKDETEVSRWLHQVASPEVTQEDATEPIEIHVKYGGDAGPDFEAVCDALSLTRAELIELHTSRVHQVEMIGFTPGFAYISGLPEDIEIPRLDQPRPRVPAGSIGLSAAFTGIYALAGPGGWPLIGRTEAKLFDADRDPAFLLSPGATLRFRER